MGKKIDQLPAAGALTGAEAFPLMQNGTTRHTVVSAVLAYILGTITTPAPGDNDTSVATTAFVQEIVDQLRGGASAGFDTLGEIEALLNAKAPLASPVFTGNPQAPTPTPGDNDTTIATTAFVTAAIAALLGGTTPATLDTLDELANALGDDANFSTTVLTALGNRLRYDAAQSLTSGQKTQAQANLGISTYIQTLLDDADATAALATLGIGGAWTAYTPTAVPTGGSTPTYSTLSGRHKVIGKTCIVSAYISPSSVAGSGLLGVSLPFNQATAQPQYLGGVNGTTGKQLTGIIDTANMGKVYLANYDATYPITAAQPLIIEGAYEIA